MADQGAIGLAEFCAQVKRELLTPEAQGRSRIPLLSVEEVVLELNAGGLVFPSNRLYCQPK